MSGSAPVADAQPFAALLAAATPSGEPAWLAARRARARARFEETGLPGPKDEAWRQTNVAPLAAIPFEAAPEAAGAAALIDDDPLVARARIRAVFVNGRFDPALSRLDALPPALAVARLAETWSSRPADLEPHLGAIAPEEERPFASLNTALFEDGAFVAVAAGAEVAEPVHVVHVAAPGSRPAAILPRTLVLAGAGARAIVVESFLGAGGAPALTSAVTEIALEANARVDHVKVQAEPVDAWHIASVAGRIGRDARLASHNVSFGARLARNDLGARLDGTGAACFLHGLYLASGTQHVDNRTWLDHAHPHCPSWEMYKGVLSGRARGVFTGRIVVREGAQKTDAKQSNKNLILSDGATVYTRPQLEIYADDVKCTHGATIGRLDEDALFYLRTRGIGAPEARDLMIRAFAGEVLDAIPDASVREILAADTIRRLEGSREG